MGLKYLCLLIISLPVTTPISEAMRRQKEIDGGQAKMLWQLSKMCWWEGTGTGLENEVFLDQRSVSFELDFSDV